MLSAPVPQQEVVEVSCSKIHKFINIIDATAYQQANGGMVIHEQGKKVWYVMPAYNGMLLGSCSEDE